LQYGFAANPKLGWKPALDGLRGFAVLAVMMRHFQYEGFNNHSVVLLPGGGIGVDLFFVLSGFLITTLLLQEWATTGSISILNFYVRRGLRLLPALAAFLVAFVVIASFVHTPVQSTGEVSNADLLKNLAAIVTYSFNWLMALGWDRVWGLGHLWSLSVEEQFYLVWPALLILLLRLRVSPLLLLGLSGAALAISASLPVIWPEERFARFYFATDYRIHTILVGCLLAQLYVGGLLTASVTRRPLFKVALAASLAFLVTAAVWLESEDRFIFLGGYTFVAIAAGFVLTAGFFANQGTGHWLLTNRAIVYVGKRSYALYLWHYAIGYWLRDLDTVPQILLSFAVSFLAAELSHRLVEAPALRLKGRFGSESETPAAKRQPTTRAPTPEPRPATVR
jgi:peptidoglycan/LPS O-acetylase OafA/YrhL